MGSPSYRLCAGCAHTRARVLPSPGAPKIRQYVRRLSIRQIGTKNGPHDTLLVLAGPGSPMLGELAEEFSTAGHVGFAVDGAQMAVGGLLG